jgi:hypothetical protein
LVSGFSPPILAIDTRGVGVTRSFAHPSQVMAVDAARSDPSTPRARARAHATQQGEQERVARKRERRLRRRERREQRDEEFRLREQQGLSPPATSEDSSEEEEEEEEEEEDDGGRALPERWEPTPPSHRKPQRRQESRCLGRAQERPSPGGPRQKRRGPRRCRQAAWSCLRAWQRRLGARRRQHRPRPQRPLSPRGRGSAASPP